MDSEISKDSYGNLWLYTNGKSIEIDSVDEIQAIIDACSLYLDIESKEVIDE